MHLCVRGRVRFVSEHTAGCASSVRVGGRRLPVVDVAGNGEGPSRGSDVLIHSHGKIRISRLRTAGARCVWYAPVSRPVSITSAYLTIQTADVKVNISHLQSQRLRRNRI